MLHGIEALCCNPKLSHPCTILSTPGDQSLFSGTALIQGYYSCLNCSGGLKRSRLLWVLDSSCALMLSILQLLQLPGYYPVTLATEEKAMTCSGQSGERKDSTRKCPDSLFPLGAIGHVSSSTHPCHHLLFLNTFSLILFCFIFQVVEPALSSSLVSFGSIWGMESSVEFLGPIFECGCSNRYPCFVSTDVLIDQGNSCLSKEASELLLTHEIIDKVNLQRSFNLSPQENLHPILPQTDSQKMPAQVKESLALLWLLYFHLEYYSGCFDVSSNSSLGTKYFYPNFQECCQQIVFRCQFFLEIA